MRHWFHEHSVRPPDARAHSGRPNDHARRPVPADHCLRSRLAQVRTGPRPTLLFRKIWRRTGVGRGRGIFFTLTPPPPPPPRSPHALFLPSPPLRGVFSLAVHPRSHLVLLPPSRGWAP